MTNEIKFADTVILVDVAYVDRVAGDLSKHFVFLFYFISFLFLYGKLFDDYQMKSQKPLNKAVTSYVFNRYLNNI